MIGIGVNLMQAGVLGGDAGVALGSGARTVTTPSITSPVAAATDVSLTPTITSSAFAVSSGSDTHASSDWQVASDAGFTSIIEQSLADAVNLTSWTVPDDLTNDTEYFVRVRHNGTTLGASAWSAGVSFTTTAVSYSAEATAYFARLTTQPSAAWKGLIDQLVLDLKAESDWNTLDCIQLWDLPNPVDAVRNLLGDFNNNTVVSATHASKLGFTGPAVGTGLSMTATYSELAITSATVGIYQTVLAAGGELVDATRMSIRNRTGSTQFRMNSTTSMTPSVTSAPAYLLARRTGSTSAQAWINGSNAATSSDTATAVPATSVSFLTGGTARARAMHFGSRLLNDSALRVYAALQTYFAGVDALP